MKNIKTNLQNIYTNIPSDFFDHYSKLFNSLKKKKHLNKQLIDKMAVNYEVGNLAIVSYCLGRLYEDKKNLTEDDIDVIEALYLMLQTFNWKILKFDSVKGDDID